MFPQELINDVLLINLTIYKIHKIIKTIDNI